MATTAGEPGRASDAEAAYVELQIRTMIRKYPGLGVHALYEKCKKEYPNWKGTKSKVYFALRRMTKNNNNDVIAVVEFVPTKKYYCRNVYDKLKKHNNSD